MLRKISEKLKDFDGICFDHLAFETLVAFVLVAGSLTTGLALMTQRLIFHWTREGTKVGTKSENNYQAAADKSFCRNV